MASLARSAPLPEESTLVANLEVVQRSRSLIQKILLFIPEVYESCIHIETLKLNSSENAKLGRMATKIGILSAPVLKSLSENFTLETGLKHMLQGLQLHRAMLSSVSPHLENKDKVMQLLDDIRDLAIQINKMLKAVVLPSPTPVALRLSGKYDVQVAAHLTLEQLQSFGQDMVRLLRTLDPSSDEEMES
ncbi:colony stimulating factor 3 (granulocyte) a isoform X2 [Labrus mixtus]|nr:colony stimulating factor 3 (granulocyte) a isoform X2 [Labrus mixtus]XP_060883584.1 colony stimulating factor 3 (granulocyte) a isoform X2 [Labrus mixtus]XP_060883585.1 colony stimulating factor 3 (granulocyte) a isoform X2 [Labrus mixtus]